MADAVFEDAAAAEARVHELEDYVARLRGLDWKRPVAVKVLDEKELRDKVSDEIADNLSDKQLADEITVYRAFDLVPEGYDLRAGALDLIGEQMAGFYDPKERCLFLVRRKQDPAAATFADAGVVMQDMVTAHELVHALQDQRYDLRDILERRYESDDTVAAIHMLVEGDASYAMYLDQFGRMGQDLDSIPLRMIMEKMGQPTDEGADMMGNAMGKTPAVLRDSLIAPYIHGPLFVQALRTEGWTKIDAAFTDLPLSTEQVIHPEKYLQRDWPQHVDFGKDRRPLGKGWKPLRENSFGELGFRSFLRHHYPTRMLRDVSSGWDGDRYRIWTNAEGTPAFVWYSVWDTEDDAQQWEVVARDWASTHEGTVERRGDVVLVTRNLPADQRDAMIASVWTDTTRVEMHAWNAVKPRKF
jgi:hypothetical protein